METVQQAKVFEDLDQTHGFEVEGQRYTLQVVHAPLRERAKRKSRGVAVTIVKNEVDIIQTWLAHVLALFDQIYIVDHSSIDGTYPYLQEVSRSGNQLHLFTFAPQGFFQAEIINRLVEIAARENPQAWIFPLDADEFISISNKEDFLAGLKKASRDRVLSLKWFNSIPISLRDDGFFTFSTPCLIPPQPGGYAKLAVHAAAFQANNWRYLQGNHQVVNGLGNPVGEDLQVEFVDLFHLPIRGFSHFVLKCIQGYLAYQALPDERRDDSQSYHRRAMINKVVQMGSFDPRMIRAFIMNYGSQTYDKQEGATIAELLRTGWESGFMNIPHVLDQVRIERQMDFFELAELALRGREIPILDEFLGIFRIWRSRFELQPTSH